MTELRLDITVLFSQIAAVARAAPARCGRRGCLKQERRVRTIAKDVQAMSGVICVRANATGLLTNEFDHNAPCALWFAEALHI
ncbi:hypothetical protein [Pseudogemmobacter bohemicus]|uniref:hypothetical protein n=1 Tax=Pseudogemmobacter bohemicus TaxID=2250708 RepID=UPI000DD3BFC6|nr:hypothetical protein [Pseudogemmobacter bohemicus]